MYGKTKKSVDQAEALIALAKACPTADLALSGYVSVAGLEVSMSHGVMTVSVECSSAQSTLATAIRLVPMLAEGLGVECGHGHVQVTCLECGVPIDLGEEVE